MPTGAELDLFVQCNGGSGDQREDTLVARNLGKIIDIPEKQVMSYLCTRDRLTVDKLSKVLRDMPDTHWGTSSAGGSGSGAGKRLTSGRSQSHGSAKFTNRVMSRARIKDIGNHLYTSTSYGNQFGSMEGGPPTKPSVTFDRIVRPGYKQAFDHWRHKAADNDVKVLAEACRALKYFNSESKAATTYNGFHSTFPGYEPRAPPEKTNARNASAVPLGSIYSQSEKEAQSAIAREQAELEAIQKGIKAHSGWCHGTESDRGERMRMSCAVFSDVPEPSIHHTFKAVPSKIPKSSNREAWHGDVHSKVQVARHDHRWVVPGATDWGMCGLTGHQISESVYAMRNPKLFPDGGAPSLQKIVTVKMARSQSVPSVTR